MKLYSQSAELRAVKAITNGWTTRKFKATSIDISSYLLSNVNSSFFHYDPARSAFDRVCQLAKKRAVILPFEELLEDMSISEEYRDIIREAHIKPILSLKQAESLQLTLSRYRKARIVYYAAKESIESLRADKVDIDALLDSLANKVTEARQETSIADPLHVFGHKGDLGDLVERALSSEDAFLLKTGFKEFDEKSGGLPGEGVLLLAGTTSGGKSVLRMNLLKNMYRLNKIDVVTLSFEMSDVRETWRLMSSLTEIPYWKFVRQALTSSEKEDCRQMLAKFTKFGVKNKCRYAILCPNRSQTITQAFMLVKPYGFKVIAIDYVSLLEGVDSENQPRVLKSIVRESKIFSAENHCLVVLLAQLDGDDDRIRYSKGMLEDADNSWVWNYTKAEDKDRHRLPIKQKKARDQELYDFELEERFSVMQVLSVPESEYSSGHGSTKTANDVVDPLDTDSTTEYAVE